MKQIIKHKSLAEKLAEADKKMRGGPRRMAWYLHYNGPSFTGEVAQQCAVSNLSDCAHRANRHLEPQGLKIVCNLPERLIRNRYGEVSQSHVWRLTVLR